MSSDLKDDLSYDAEKQVHAGVPELNVEEVTEHRNGVHDADRNEDGSDGLHRNLKSRHTSMLAIGGAIGTGLVIGSGVGLTRAGPVGLLIAFMFVGTLCYAMIVALGEMAAFLPHQRGFPGHATRFVNAGFGGMTGLTYYFKYLIGTPTQFSAAAVVINVRATEVASEASADCLRPAVLGTSFESQQRRLDRRFHRLDGRNPIRRRAILW